jgi:hypothetical protein
MNDSGFMRVLQRFRKLPRDRKNFFDWDRAESDAIRQGRSIDQLHDERLDILRPF